MLPTAVFFNRIFHDYSYLLNENAKHWESILPNDIPALEGAARFYANLLVNATYHCSIVEGCERQISLLDELVSDFPMDLNIAIPFANGLLNLSIKQDEQGARDTIARLESLAAEHPDVPDIVIALANGLVNLSIKQDEQGARDAIARLENFVAEHPNVPAFVTALTKDLENVDYEKNKNSNG